MVLWACILVSLCTASALPTLQTNVTLDQNQTDNNDTIPRNSFIENLILTILEDLREFMVTGSDLVAPLDPLIVKHVVVDDSTLPIPGAYLQLHNLTVSKLSTFEITNLNVETASIVLRRYNIRISGHIPEVIVDVDKYDLDVRAFGFHIFGSGDAIIKLIKPHLDLDVLINVRIGVGALYLYVMDCNIVLGLGDIKPEITGMFNDATVSQFVNSVLRHFVLDAMTTFAEQISDIVSPIVMGVVNEIIEDINLIGLMS